ncbi:hypothetical protein MMC30_006287 [Trapelia coarctata]|nr:hypothetical protein [Trapelia coarctata]
MKLSAILSTSLLSICASPVLSRLVLPNLFPKRDAVAPRQQHPIQNEPNIALPMPDNEKMSEGSSPAGDVIISDVIGRDHIINVFAGFTRDIDSISRRLDDNTQNSTILAPLNSELMKLPHKPWEDPRDYGALGQGAYEGEGGEDRAHKNLRRFVEAHVVPVSPWAEGEKVETLGGKKIWWEESDGKKTIQPGNIEVSSVASRVSNGEVWIIKGVLNNA